MSDFSSFWNVDEMIGDWQEGAGMLSTDYDLQTVILISLFTDRLARFDDNYGDSDRRGWWGDTGEDQGDVLHAHGVDQLLQLLDVHVALEGILLVLAALGDLI